MMERILQKFLVERIFDKTNQTDIRNIIDKTNAKDISILINSPYKANTPLAAYGTDSSSKMMYELDRFFSPGREWKTDIDYYIGKFGIDDIRKDFIESGGVVVYKDFSSTPRIFAEDGMLYQLLIDIRFTKEITSMVSNF